MESWFPRRSFGTIFVVHTNFNKGNFYFPRGKEFIRAGFRFFFSVVAKVGALNPLRSPDTCATRNDVLNVLSCGCGPYPPGEECNGHGYVIYQGPENRTICACFGAWKGIQCNIPFTKQVCRCKALLLTISA